MRLNSMEQNRITFNLMVEYQAGQRFALRKQLFLTIFYFQMLMKNLKRTKQLDRLIFYIQIDNFMIILLMFSPFII